METFWNSIILTGKYLLISLSALAIFGLILAMAWALLFSEVAAYKLITALLAACLAIFAGGYLMGAITKSGKPIRHATEWGLLIGFAGFGYLFGIDWKWLLALILSGLLATSGGWLSQSWQSQK